MLGQAELVAFVPTTNPKRARVFYEGIADADYAEMPETAAEKPQLLLLLSA